MRFPTNSTERQHASRRLCLSRHTRYPEKSDKQMTGSRISGSCGSSAGCWSRARVPLGAFKCLELCSGLGRGAQRALIDLAATWQEWQDCVTPLRYLGSWDHLLPLSRLETRGLGIATDLLIPRRNPGSNPGILGEPGRNRLSLAHFAPVPPSPCGRRR